MTALHKIVRREIERDPRPIVVSLVPADHGVPALLVFREKGRRRSFVLPVGAAYQEAIRRALLAARAEKARKKGKPRQVSRGLLTT